MKFRERFDRQMFFYHAFHCLSFNKISGDYAEFGCCGGTTFGLAYGEIKRHKYPRKMWAYDSFQGLPAHKSDKDYHPQWIEKTMKIELDEFHQTCACYRIPRNNYQVIAGFYEQSLAVEETKEPQDIALAYIDCDLYSSTLEVLQFLLPRCKHGMIIAFDDYYCWSDKTPSGEKMAMEEIFSNHPKWNLVPYIRFGWHGQSFVLEAK